MYFTSTMVVELVVTGAVCLFLSFAVVAITIHSFTKRKKNREQESLLHHNSRSNKRYQKKIRIQKTSNIPAKHLRSLSVEFTESPTKRLYKYPQQHYRRKSSPNMVYIPKNKQKDTMINIYPNFKCDKLFALQQIQPVSNSGDSSGYSSCTTTTMDSKATNPSSMTGPINVGATTKNLGSLDDKTSAAKTRHLYLPEAKGYFAEYFAAKKPQLKISTSIYKEYEKRYNFVKE